MATIALAKRARSGDLDLVASEIRLAEDMFERLLAGLRSGTDDK